MNLLRICLVSLVGSAVMGHAAANPAWNFAEGWFENRQRTVTDAAGIQDTDPRSTAIWAGGHAGPYPTPIGSVPQAENVPINGQLRSIRLEQSAIGQLVAGPLGFPGADLHFLQVAGAKVFDGAKYGSFDTLTGPLKRPDGAWDIVFPGVIDLVAGKPWPEDSNKPQNFFEADILAAAEACRVALRINPVNADAANGLLSTVHHRMVPRVFGGNNGFVHATAARLVAGNPFLGEMSSLSNALGFFQAASRVLIDAAADPVLADLLAGANPSIPASVLQDTRLRLLDTYVRALAQEGETVLRIVRLRSLNEYTDPNRPNNHNPSPLLAEIDSELTSLRDRMILLNLFRDVDGFGFSDQGKVEYCLEQLAGMRGPIQAGMLSFGGNRFGTNEVVEANSPSSFAQIAPDYIPFLFREGTKNSFEALSQVAQDFINYSVAADKSAKEARRDWDGNESILRGRLVEISIRYRSELADLCGVVRDPQGQLQPDVFLALLPPVERLRVGRIFDPGYLPNETGKLYQEWKKVQAAQLGLEGAQLDLSNTLSEMQKKQEIANRITHGQENIAYLILDNGDKVAALDRQGGNIRAALARTEARIRAQAAIYAGAAQAVGSIIGGILTKGPAGLGDAVGGSIGAAGKAAAEANAAFESGKSQADAARQIAEIQAQMTQIQSTERAKIQFQLRDETLLRTEEAMHSLMLQGERQKLNILIAEQTFDAAQAGLANMVSRVHFLLQEYRSASQQTLADPLASADYRLTRDLQARASEETFALAQEWTYLTAKAGQYKVNGAAQASSVETLIKKTLAARKGDALQDALNGLKDGITSLASRQGREESVQREVLSLRHYIFQNNFAVTDTNGTLLPGSQMELTSGGSTAAASDAEWAQFLQANVSTNPITGRRSLSLVFSTALTQPSRVITDGSQRKDFLFREKLFNALITYGTQAGANGVRLNIRARGLANYDPVRDGDILVNLKQEGASYVRNRPYCVGPQDPFCGDPDGSGINVWNLEPINAQLTAFLNGFRDTSLDRYASPRFHERSPANDRWVLTLASEAGNPVLLAQLDKIADIEIEFSFTGYSN